MHFSSKIVVALAWWQKCAVFRMAHLCTSDTRVTVVWTRTQVLSWMWGWAYLSSPCCNYGMGLCFKPEQSGDGSWQWAWQNQIGAANSLLVLACCLVDGHMHASTRAVVLLAHPQPPQELGLSVWALFLFISNYFWKTDEKLFSSFLST